MAEAGVQRTDNPLHDIKGVYDVLRERDLVGELRKLQGGDSLRSAFALALDWGLVVLSWVAVLVFGWWVVPAALLLSGTRQRALGNLLHEAGHKMLLPQPRWNDRVADLLIGIPFASPLRLYRAGHASHHAHLGLEEADPDLIHSEDDLSKGSWRLFAKHTASLHMLKVNMLGHLPRLSGRELGAFLLWWGVALGALGLATGIGGAGLFLALWLSARLLVFHPVTTFREISDHVGLEPGSVIGFTRNSPSLPVMGFFFHPHHNNYHLTHHLAPKVPFHRLAKAHRIFMEVPAYAHAHHCDRYFTGRRSLVGCWVRRCLDWPRRQLLGRSGA